MQQTQYQPVGIRLRAPRFALAYHTMSDWVHMARKAVAGVSRVWGGAGAVLLPVAEASGQVQAADALLPLLRLYDPDHVAGLLPTLADAAHMDPSVISRMVTRYALPDEAPDAAWRRLSSQSLPTPGWEGLASQVDAWCSPFKGVGQGQQRFTAQSVHHMVHAGTSRRSLATVPAQPGEPVVTLDLSGVDPAVALMVESRIGAVHPHARTHLNTVELPVDVEDLPAIIHLAVTGKPRADWDLADRYRRAAGGVPTDGLTASEFSGSTPFAHSARWTIEAELALPTPIVWIVGETAEDHALAMLCDRLYQHAVWIPPRLLSDGGPFTRAVKVALSTFQGVGHGGKLPILLASASQSQSDLQALAEDFNRPFAAMTMCVDDGPPAPLSVRQVKAVTLAELAAYDGMTLFADPDAYQISQQVPTSQEGGSVSLLMPLQLPEAQAAAHLGAELHWYIDVQLPFHTLPARTAISDSCLTQKTTGIPDTVTRAARHAVSFISANMGFSTPANPYARPLLHFPSADRVFEELASSRGATVERSSAGVRAAIAVEMWGSPDALAADLSGPTRNVLNAFLPPPKKRDGAYEPGYAIRGNGYVALEDIQTTLGDDTFDAARDLVDRLLIAKVLRRGLLLNCARCRYEAFYRIDLVGPAFDCEACGHASPLTRGRWYARDAEPHWYYALDHVVQDLLQQHGDVPLLAAQRLRQNSYSMLWSPELVVSDAEGSVELDLCLIVNGRVIIGEAKSNHTLKASNGTQEAAARLVRAAQLLSADEIVLATSKRAWAKDTLSAVNTAVNERWASGPRPIVTELVGVGACT
ncbi:hypothetical protein [Streptomyces sp. 3214.6]|uniref:hypothetical protein n=1 Tax=Streptomyces sp. 3214.6 TaxID=1882757 RepID=UPI00090B070D|nr:hypothetical protein [Streptomyces sp. 3214.6]SHH33103.1 hypothetical protein SAMN05444521_0147 [Streptomyces sp. 3214.6]